MSNDLKFIISEVNKTLKTNYNLMSFDSFSSEKLLQIVVDVLSFYNIIEKFDIKIVDHELTKKRIFVGLKTIHYNTKHIVTLHQSMTQIEKEAIYSILNYIYQNKNKIRNITYLAQFLSPLQISDEAISNTEIGYLWKEYLNQIDEFKIAHKGHVKSLGEETYIKELKNDITAIEAEKKQILERINRIKIRLDRIHHKDVLEKAQILRQEKNREKEIHMNLKEQKIEIHRGKVIQNQYKKEFSNNKTTYANLLPDYILKNIEEEADVLKFLVKQKLPKELKTLENKCNEIENVNKLNLSKDKEYNKVLQHKVEEKSIHIQNLVESISLNKSNYEDAQKLMVFKQQVGIIIKRKDAAMEVLNGVSKDILNIKATVVNKQNQIESVFGDSILRGEELKQYVNKLKSKNLIYKQNRTELSALKADNTDLMKMLQDLKFQEPNLNVELVEVDKTQFLQGLHTPIKEKGLTEILRITEALERAINVKRSQLAPMTQKIKQLKEQTFELNDEKNSKKQIYNNIDITLQTEASLLQNKIQEKEINITELEQNCKKLQSNYKRAETLLEKVNYNTNSRHDIKVELKEEIKKQILDKEISFKQFEEQAQSLFSNQNYSQKQCQFWNSVEVILNVKLSYFTELDNNNSGVLSIQKNIETFILN